MLCEQQCAACTLTDELLLQLARGLTRGGDLGRALSCSQCASKPCSSSANKRTLQRKVQSAAPAHSPIVGAGQSDALKRGNDLLVSGSSSLAHRARPASAAQACGQQADHGRAAPSRAVPGVDWRPTTAAPTAPQRELWSDDLQHPPRFCAGCHGVQRPLLHIYMLHRANACSQAQTRAASGLSHELTCIKH